MNQIPLRIHLPSQSAQEFLDDGFTVVADSVNIAAEVIFLRYRYEKLFLLHTSTASLIEKLIKFKIV